MREKWLDFYGISAYIGVKNKLSVNPHFPMLLVQWLGFTKFAKYDGTSQKENQEMPVLNPVPAVHSFALVCTFTWVHVSICKIAN